MPIATIWVQYSNSDGHDSDRLDCWGENCYDADDRNEEDDDLVL